ncbi:MAG: PilZ domain-containing protein [Nevskiales bacterium]
MDTEATQADANNDSQAAVSCTLFVPLAWHSDGHAPRPGEDLHQRNLQCLHYIEALETHSHRKSESPSEIELEIHRMESKLNLALDLLASLLAQTQARPAASSVELSAAYAQWLPTPDIQGEQRGRLHLHLHPLLATPVELPGTLSLQPADNPQGLIARCQFDPMPDDLNDALLAFVFRGHRRAVAEKRLQSD